MSVQRQFLLGDTQIEAFPGARVRENKQRYSEIGCNGHAYIAL